MEIHKRFEQDLGISIILSKILSNICGYPELLEEIYRSGWIGILAQWIKHDDIRIAAPAAKALSNLDGDNENESFYSRRIYILHPMMRRDDKKGVDVVFVHGLLGGVFFTWRQRAKNDTTLGLIESITSESLKGKRIIKSSDPIMREYVMDVEEQQQLEWDRMGADFEFVLPDLPVNTNIEARGPYTCPGNHSCLKESKEYTQCWPRDWLTKDCKNIRVIGIDYDTSLSMWAPMCSTEQVQPTLEQRSDEFMLKLLNAGVGRRPIVWVTHSMGGLLVKNMLCKAWESDVEECKNMCLNTKGIVFYSTPHAGSKLATLSQSTDLLLWPSVEVQELREESPGLKELHKKFLNLTKELPFNIISFVETKSTLVTAMKFSILLVDTQSANPGIGEFFEIPQDHLGICKPHNKQSFLYQKVVHLINDVIENFT